MLSLRKSFFAHHLLFILVAYLQSLWCIVLTVLYQKYILSLNQYSHTNLTCIAANYKASSFF